MPETVVVALISAGATLIVCLINNAFQAEKAEKQRNETIALIQYKIDELSDRVNKHNSIIERTYKLEKRAAVFEEKMTVANHRIDDLEKKG